MPRSYRPRTSRAATFVVAATASVAILITATCIAADIRPTGKQLGERDSAVYAMTSTDGAPVTIELRIRDGGQICGPADIIGRIESKHTEVELYHVRLGECIGGEWPNWTFPKPEPTPTPSPTLEERP